MSRFLRIPFLLAAIPLLFFLWHIGLRVPLELVVRLGFGWLIFLVNVVPALTVRWTGVLTAIVALGVFLVGFHCLAAWFTAAQKQADGEGTAVGSVFWPWRWTLLVASLVFVMFVAGIAVVGMAHQVAWLAMSKEPVIENNSLQFRRLESRQNLTRVGQALDQHLEKDERFPAGGTFTPDGRPDHSWQTALLPFIDQQGLYERIDQSVPWDDVRNRPAMATVVPDYLNPALSIRTKSAESGPALSHYAGNGWVLGGGPALRKDAISDGLSNTLMSGEVDREVRPWGHPLNWRDPMLGINRVPDGFGSPFHFGAHFLLGDGSVRFLNDNIDPTVLKALATPNGGESTGEF